MKMRERYVALFFLVLFGLSAKGQDICTVDDGRLVFHLRAGWDTEKRMEVSEQFGLDSLLLEKALSAVSGAPLNYEGVTWKVMNDGNGSIELSKNMGEMKGQMNWKKNVIYAPDGVGTGPGYVDMESVQYGVNRLSEAVIIQFFSGVTKFILEGHKNADEVFISGSFNNWSTSELPMQRKGDGWEIDLELDPGKYLYKFVVDGEWIKAPGNSLVRNDGWDGKNSVFYQYNYEFVLDGYPDAKKVYLAGSFNGWDKTELRMAKTSAGWKLPLYLREGTHAYKFVVDGEWVTDPDNPVVRPDGAGNFNSFMSIGDTTMFRLNGYTQANQVRLAGSFNAWNPAELVMSKTAGGWELPYVLAKGNYEYKFIVDGEWITDPANPYHIRHGENQNSILAVQPNQKFELGDFREAKQVLVTGTFNGWSESNNIMVMEEAGWAFPIYLKPGKHLYKFLVDGEWMIDPKNPTFEENEFETGNSVLWIEKQGVDQ